MAKRRFDRLRKIVAELRARLRAVEWRQFDHWLYDLLGLVGFCMFGVGLWMIYPPACLLVNGAFLMVLAYYGASLWNQTHQR